MLLGCLKLCQVKHSSRDWEELYLAVSLPRLPWEEGSSGRSVLPGVEYFISVVVSTECCVKLALFQRARGRPWPCARSAKLLCHAEILLPLSTPSSCFYFFLEKISEEIFPIHSFTNILLSISHSKALLCCLLWKNAFKMQYFGALSTAPACQLHHESTGSSPSCFACHSSSW